MHLAFGPGSPVEHPCCRMEGAILGVSDCGACHAAERVKPRKKWEHRERWAPEAPEPNDA